MEGCYFVVLQERDVGRVFGERGDYFGLLH